MEMMIFTCPTTGRETSTGIHVEPESFKRLSGTVTNAVCPHCGTIHCWWTHEARLSYNFELSRSGAPQSSIRAQSVAGGTPSVKELIGEIQGEDD
jgi:hypothetical protein